MSQYQVRLEQQSGEVCNLAGGNCVARATRGVAGRESRPETAPKFHVVGRFYLLHFLTMCGRFTLTTGWQALAERFCVAPVEAVNAPPRFNIAPSQSVIVIGNDGQRSMKQMRWGLIPSWVRDPNAGSSLINARAETLAEKPSFRDALKRRRCIIPADGFYEWQKLGKVRQPVRIVLKSREPFGLAGLWDCWISPEKEEILTCTIITTSANDLIRGIHDRMPVLLNREDEAQWLDPKNDDPAKLLRLLQSYPSELMEYYPVSRQVNSPHVDEPSNLTPISAV